MHMDAKIFENHLNPVGIHWIALAENSQMSTHQPGFQYYFPEFFNHFVLVILATSSIRVKVFLEVLVLQAYFNGWHQHLYHINYGLLVVKEGFSL